MAGERLDDDDADATTLALVSGVNVRELPIGPLEAFVLSRIEGVTSRDDLVIATGLSSTEIADIVARLIVLGVVVEAGRRVPGGPTTMRSGAHSIPLVAQKLAGGELSLEQQGVLLDLDRRGKSIDHYQLLGVSREADAKEIRAAYYELVRVYHPDRFFGKALGGYEAPLLRVFSRFTEAYETLRRPDSRAEYDRYLSARQRTKELDRYFREPLEELAPVGRSPSAAPPPTSLVPPASVPPASVPPASSPEALRSSSSQSFRRPSSVPASDPEARRRALARKLGLPSVPPRSSSPAPTVSAAEHAGLELKRRYEERLTQARSEQLAHYVSLAKAAEERNDLVAAANSLRLACSLAPGNLELAGDLAELERRAAAALWESYLERAKYAAVEGNLVEAAEAYERAALGQPHASYFERAAFYTLESGGDLKRASKLAKQAVALAPNSAKCRLTLAQIYAGAKLFESALAELERARVLEPNQPLIKEWIQRVKRGDA